MKGLFFAVISDGVAVRHTALLVADSVQYVLTLMIYAAFSGWVFPQWVYLRSDVGNGNRTISNTTSNFNMASTGTNSSALSGQDTELVWDEWVSLVERHILSDVFTVLLILSGCACAFWSARVGIACISLANLATSLTILLVVLITLDGALDYEYLLHLIPTSFFALNLIACGVWVHRTTYYKGAWRVSIAALTCLTTTLILAQLILPHLLIGKWGGAVTISIFSVILVPLTGLVNEAIFVVNINRVENMSQREAMPVWYTISLALRVLCCLAFFNADKLSTTILVGTASAVIECVLQSLSVWRLFLGLRWFKASPEHLDAYRKHLGSMMNVKLHQQLQAVVIAQSLSSFFRFYTKSCVSVGVEQRGSDWWPAVAVIVLYLVEAVCAHVTSHMLLRQGIPLISTWRNRLKRMWIVQLVDAIAMFYLAMFMFSFDTNIVFYICPAHLP